MKPSILLRPLVPIYSVGAGLKNKLYDFGWLHAQQLAWPVVSVGNLSVGGTGKTPFVCELAMLLQQRGWYVDVLSRGHGRVGSQVEAVNPSGSVRRYGDEPLMMARNGLPVYVGCKRYDAGRCAEAEFSSAESSDGEAAQRALHLLDDGFQHRKLARAVDMVLLERSDLAESLLPAGRLREPLASLQRADICVLREEDRDLCAQVMAAMRTEDATRVWLQRRTTKLDLARTSSSATVLFPQRALAFCGIGNAAQFFTGLRNAGVSLAAEITFRDHHPYSDQDIGNLLEHARACHADGLVTTEKDSMRLEGELRETLEAAVPLHIASLVVTLLEPERCLAQIETLLV